MTNRSELVGTLKIWGVVYQTFSAKNRTFSENLCLIPVEKTILPIITTCNFTLIILPTYPVV